MGFGLNRVYHPQAHLLVNMGQKKGQRDTKDSADMTYFVTFVRDPPHISSKQLT